MMIGLNRLLGGGDEELDTLDSLLIEMDLDTIVEEKKLLQAEIEYLRNSETELYNELAHRQETIKRLRNLHKHEMDHSGMIQTKNVALKERLRRQEEIHEQEKINHSTTISQYQETISDLRKKLDAVQIHSDISHDDQCVSEWRSLERTFENWTTKTFINDIALNKMTSIALSNKGLKKLPPAKVLERGVHTRRAFIRSRIAWFIYDHIFCALFVQSPSSEVLESLQTMASRVKNQGNDHMWKQWRSATSRGLECFNCPERLHELHKFLISRVEYYFGEYYDQELSSTLIHQKFKQFFLGCVEFKCKLERGEFDYQFQRSEIGVFYSKEHMKSVNAEDDEGAIVQMSVWPGIAKISADNDRLLLEREAVWTSVPVEKSEPVMERGHELENNSTRRNRKLKEEMSA